MTTFMPEHDNAPSFTAQARIVELKDQLTWNAIEAAMMCGISPSTFRDWVRKGLLPQPSHGKRYSAYAVQHAFMIIDATRSRDVCGDAYDNWSSVNG